MIGQVEVFGLCYGAAMWEHTSAAAALGRVLRPRPIHGHLRALPAPAAGYV